MQYWTAPIVFQSLCGIPLGLFKLIVRFLGPSERNPGKADEIALHFHKKQIALFQTALTGHCFHTKIVIWDFGFSSKSLVKQNLNGRPLAHTIRHKKLKKKYNLFFEKMFEKT